MTDSAPAPALPAALSALAAQLAAEGHALEAARAFTALLACSLLPAEEAAARLRLASLLIDATSNVADAKAQLQRAELVAKPLPGHVLLKAEILAELGRAHRSAGEHAFERAAYAKGLELARDTHGAPATTKRALQEWVVFFHLHSAESFLADREPAKAAEHAQAAADAAQAADLAEQQLVCLLFQLQLALLLYDKPALEARSAAASELLGRLEAGGPPVAQLRLHLTILQVVSTIQQGNFQEVSPPSEPSPAMIAQLEALVDGLPAAAPAQRPGPGSYAWLPPTALGALVQLLAALVLKPSGKAKPALNHITRGLAMIDAELESLQLTGPGVSEAALDHVSIYQARPLLLLRVLLLEARQQLNLLSSEFAAARADVAEAIQLAARFPTLLAGLQPSVHLQVGLYAQAVGASDASLAHFRRAAAAAPAGSRLSLHARCLAALVLLAQDTPQAASAARELLPDLAGEEAGYAERAVGHIAGALLALAGAEVSGDERADAKQRLSKGLKLAHGRLQNHQLVSQLLLFMTPLQVAAADTSGALQMVTSSITLSKGAGDLHAQVAGLSMMQQLFHQLKRTDQAAQNANYLLRKQDELSARIQAAEAQGAQHAAVLAWDCA